MKHFTGQEPTDKVVDGMMSEAPGPLNFTMFLTLFGEKLNGVCVCCVCVVLCCVVLCCVADIRFHTLTKYGRISASIVCLI